MRRSIRSYMAISLEEIDMAVFFKSHSRLL